MSSIRGTNVIAPLVPFDTEDVFPTHLPIYGKGSYRTTTTTGERNSIKPFRREEGMLVYVKSTKKIYKLLPGFSPTNVNLLTSDWQELTLPSTPNLDIQKDGVSADSATSIINITGTGAVVTQTSPGEVEVNIPGGTSASPSSTTIEAGLTLQAASIVANMVKWEILIVQGTTRSYSLVTAINVNGTTTNHTESNILGLLDYSIITSFSDPNLILSVKNNMASSFTVTVLTPVSITY